MWVTVVIFVESLKLWKARSVQVMYAIGNCLVGLKV